MTNHTRHGAARVAFTLIELLVVIAIIAVLAALIFPAAGAIKRRATITKVQTELKRVAAAIDLFKEKHGIYPPGNPNNVVTNQLYFELIGSVLTNLSASRYGFLSLDGGAQISTNDVPPVFGVGGFINCLRGTGGEEVLAPKNFFKGIKPAQYGGVSTSSPEIRLLVCSVPWPTGSPYQPVASNPGLNPWRYTANPTNNPGSYDLWVDVLIAGKTNRISNWSQLPQLVSTP